MLEDKYNGKCHSAMKQGLLKASLVCNKRWGQTWSRWDTIHLDGVSATQASLFPTVLTDNMVIWSRRSIQHETGVL